MNYRILVKEAMARTLKHCGGTPVKLLLPVSFRYGILVEVADAVEYITKNKIPLDQIKDNIVAQYFNVEVVEFVSWIDSIIALPPSFNIDH